MDECDPVTAVVVDKYIAHPNMGRHVTGKCRCRTGDGNCARVYIKIGSRDAHRAIKRGCRSCTILIGTDVRGRGIPAITVDVISDRKNGIPIEIGTRPLCHRITRIQVIIIASLVNKGRLPVYRIASRRIPDIGNIVGAVRMKSPGVWIR